MTPEVYSELATRHGLEVSVSRETAAKDALRGTT